MSAESSGLPCALVVDHLRCVRDRLYLKRMARKMYGLGERRGVVSMISALHENDDSCCKLEPWPETSARIFAKMSNLTQTETFRFAADLEAKMAEHESDEPSQQAESADAARLLADIGVDTTDIPVRSFHLSARDLLPFPEGSCDFCCTEHAVVEFPCRDFAVPVPESAPPQFVAMRGAWRACDSCKNLIDTGRDGDLLTRCVDLGIAAYAAAANVAPENIDPAARRRMQQMTATNFGLFRSHRIT